MPPHSRSNTSGSNRSGAGSNHQNNDTHEKNTTGGGSAKIEPRSSSRHQSRSGTRTTAPIDDDISSSSEEEESFEPITSHRQRDRNYENAKRDKKNADSQDEASLTTRTNKGRFKKEGSKKSKKEDRGSRSNRQNGDIDENLDDQYASNLFPDGPNGVGSTSPVERDEGLGDHIQMGANLLTPSLSSSHQLPSQEHTDEFKAAHHATMFTWSQKALECIEVVKLIDDANKKAMRRGGPNICCPFCYCPVELSTVYEHMADELHHLSVRLMESYQLIPSAPEEEQQELQEQRRKSHSLLPQPPFPPFYREFNPFEHSQNQQNRQHDNYNNNYSNFGNNNHNNPNFDNHNNFTNNYNNNNYQNQNNRNNFPDNHNFYNHNNNNNNNFGFNNNNNNNMNHSNFHGSSGHQMNMNMPNYNNNNNNNNMNGQFNHCNSNMGSSQMNQNGGYDNGQHQNASQQQQQQHNPPQMKNNFASNNTQSTSNHHKNDVADVGNARVVDSVGDLVDNLDDVDDDITSRPSKIRITDKNKQFMAPTVPKHIPPQKELEMEEAGSNTVGQNGQNDGHGLTDDNFTLAGSDSHKSTHQGSRSRSRATIMMDSDEEYEPATEEDDDEEYQERTPRKLSKKTSAGTGTGPSNRRSSSKTSVKVAPSAQQDLLLQEGQGLVQVDGQEGEQVATPLLKSRAGRPSKAVLAARAASSTTTTTTGDMGEVGQDVVEIQGAQTVQGGGQGVEGIQNIVHTEGLGVEAVVEAVVEAPQKQEMQDFVGIRNIEAQAIPDVQVPQVQEIQGVHGAQSAQGVHGAQGAQIAHSLQGFHGVQGVHGVQGFQGFQGVQGFHGVHGVHGGFGDVMADSSSTTTTTTTTITDLSRQVPKPKNKNIYKPIEPPQHVPFGMMSMNFPTLDSSLTVHGRRKRQHFKQAQAMNDESNEDNEDEDEEKQENGQKQHKIIHQVQQMDEEEYVTQGTKPGNKNAKRNATDLIKFFTHHELTLPQDTEAYSDSEESEMLVLNDDPEKTFSCNYSHYKPQQHYLSFVYTPDILEYSIKELLHHKGHLYILNTREIWDDGVEFKALLPTTYCLSSSNMAKYPFYCVLCASLVRKSDDDLHHQQHLEFFQRYVENEDEASDSCCDFCCLEFASPALRRNHGTSRVHQAAVNHYYLLRGQCTVQQEVKLIQDMVVFHQLQARAWLFLQYQFKQGLLSLPKNSTTPSNIPNIIQSQCENSIAALVMAMNALIGVNYEDTDDLREQYFQLVTHNPAKIAEGTPFGLDYIEELVIKRRNEGNRK